MSELVLTNRAALALIDQAEQALAEVTVPEDADQLWRKVKAVEEAARLARISEVAVVGLRRVQLRAKRRYGELLGEPATGRPAKNVSPRNESATSTSDRLSDHRARKLAAVPANTFEATLAEPSIEKISEAAILRADKRDNRPTPAPVAAAEGSFLILYADPPWRYDHVSTPDARAVENQYPTMALDEIKALDVPAADDAVLFMWATSPKLAESLEVVAAWDFEYRTCAVWVKDRIGMGYYFRQQHELLLVAKRGALPPPAPSLRPSSVIEAPRTAHSAKPEEAAALIERMYPDAPKVELFARHERDGWASWGNQLAVAA